MTTSAKQPLRRGVMWLMGTTVVMAVGLGGWFWYVRPGAKSAGAVQADVVTVRRATVEETVNESGTVELSNQQQLRAAVTEAGVVEQVLVRVGDWVQTGQPLITLRNPDQQTRLAEHELEIEKQRAAIVGKRQQVLDKRDELLDGVAEKALAVRKQELDLASKQKAVLRSREKLVEAEQKFKLYQQAFEKGFISKDELASEQEAVRAAQTDLEQADADVTIAKLDLDRAIVTLNQTQQKVDTGVLAVEQELQIALRDLEKAQLESQKIDEELQTNVVTAPSTGVVLDVQARPGDVVNADKVLLTIGNPLREMVKLSLSPLNARKVKPNQLVRVRELVPNAQPYTGRVNTVARIATSGDEDQGGGGGAGQGQLGATVRLDRPSRSLIPGVQVDVEIVVAQQKDTIALAPELIQRDGGQSFVWLLDRHDRARKQVITLGLDAITVVEVTKGLEVGDRVIQLPPDTTLKPGTAIKFTTPKKP